MTEFDVGLFLLVNSRRTPKDTYEVTALLKTKLPVDECV